MTEAASPQSSDVRTRGRLAAALSAHRALMADILVVALLSVLARLPWVLIVHAVPTSDSYFYFLSAKSLSAGHGYSILGHQTAFFPVGWPAFLAGLFLVTGPAYAAIETLNLILWAVTAVLTYGLGRRLGGRAVGLVSGILVAVAPSITIYAMRASSEALFIPLLLIVCLLLAGRRETPSLRRTALAGVLLGVSILVRSTAELLPLVLPLWLLLRRPWRESWRAALVLAVAACLVLVPWAVRNAVVMHSFTLSTNGGYTVWIGANPGATGGFGVRGHHPKWGIDSVASEVRQDSVLTGEAVSFVTHHPLQWLGLTPAKFRYLMSWGAGPLRNSLQGQVGPDPRIGFYERRLDASARALVQGALNAKWAFALWHYLYWVLGGAALVLATWRRRPTASIALLLVVFWIVFHSTLVHGEPRYMLSVTPLVAPALAWMLVSGWRRLRRLRTRGGV